LVTNILLSDYAPNTQGVQLKSWRLTKPWIYHVRCYL